jgi:hypothetical protein
VILKGKPTINVITMNCFTTNDNFFESRLAVRFGEKRGACRVLVRNVKEKTAVETDPCVGG